MKSSLGVFAIIMLAAVICTAQTQPSREMAAAAELIKAKKYDDAAAAYKAIVAKEPANGPAWYQLATAEYFLNEYRASAAAYEKNIPISGNPFAMYNLAGVYSLLGEKQKALDWLQKSLDSPKMVAAVVNFEDPDLSNIKSDPQFLAMRDKTDRKVRPCIYMDKAKQLDFWVGEWDVYNPQGRRDGSSVVESFASGCGVLENWTGTFGGGGKSINFYDPAADKWFQYWIGAAGGPLRYSGVFRDGAMRYEGESSGPNGTKSLIRLSFFNVDPNTVRQLAENSTDGGRTWTTSYDYKYIRKK